MEEVKTKHLTWCSTAQVDQVDRADQVGLVVVAADEVAQPFGGIGSQMVDVVELLGGKERRQSRIVGHRHLHPAGAGRYVVQEAPAEVVQGHHLHAHVQQMSSDMRSNEAGRAGHQCFGHVTSRDQVQTFRRARVAIARWPPARPGRATPARWPGSRGSPRCRRKAGTSPATASPP